MKLEVFVVKFGKTSKILKEKIKFICTPNTKKKKRQNQNKLKNKPILVKMSKYC